MIKINLYKKEAEIAEQKKVNGKLNLFNQASLFVYTCVIPLLAVTNDSFQNYFLTESKQFFQPAPLTAIGFLMLFSMTKIANDNSIHNIIENQKNNTGEIEASGLFSKIRHPCYALQMGMATSLLGIFPSLEGLGFLAINYLLTDNLAKREEQQLLLEFDSYQEYMDETPRWIPKLSSIINKSNA